MDDYSENFKRKACSIFNDKIPDQFLPNLTSPTERMEDWDKISKLSSDTNLLCDLVYIVSLISSLKWERKANDSLLRSFYF